MKVTTEISIHDFQAWSGAIETKNTIINHGKAEEFDELIEELFPQGIDETQLNDLLWFDSEWVLEYLGISEQVED